MAECYFLYEADMIKNPGTEFSMMAMGLNEAQAVLKSRGNKMPHHLIIEAGSLIILPLLLHKFMLLCLCLSDRQCCQRGQKPSDGIGIQLASRDQQAFQLHCSFAVVLLEIEPCFGVKTFTLRS